MFVSEATGKARTILLRGIQRSCMEEEHGQKILEIHFTEVEKTWYTAQLSSKRVFFEWLLYNMQNEIRLEKHLHWGLNLLHFKPCGHTGHAISTWSSNPTALQDQQLCSELYKAFYIYYLKGQIKASQMTEWQWTRFTI